MARISWDEVGERKLLGPEIVQVMIDNVKVIRDRLKIAQDRQESYADNRMRDLEFQVGIRYFRGITLERGVAIQKEREVKSPLYGTL